VFTLPTHVSSQESKVVSIPYTTATVLSG